MEVVAGQGDKGGGRVRVDVRRACVDGGNVAPNDEEDRLILGERRQAMELVIVSHRSGDTEEPQDLNGVVEFGGHLSEGNSEVDGGDVVYQTMFAQPAGDGRLAP